jgi:hypothetical protein
LGHTQPHLNSGLSNWVSMKFWRRTNKTLRINGSRISRMLVFTFRFCKQGFHAIAIAWKTHSVNWIIELWIMKNGLCVNYYVTWKVKLFLKSAFAWVQKLEGFSTIFYVS